MTNNEVKAELRSVMHDTYTVSREALDYVAEMMKGEGKMEQEAIRLALAYLGFEVLQRDEFFILSKSELETLRASKQK